MPSAQYPLNSFYLESSTHRTLETSVQAQFLIPMAISLSFGIMFSTGITLLLVPTLNMILEDFCRLAGLEELKIFYNKLISIRDCQLKAVDFVFLSFSLDPLTPRHLETFFYI